MCCNSAKKNHHHDGQYLTSKALRDYYTKTEVDGLIPDLSNYYTKTEVDELLDVPAFLAFQTQTQGQVTGDGTEYTVPFDSVSYNYGGGYSSSTNVFTAPVDGVYNFSGVLCSGGYKAAHDYLLHKLETSNKAFTLNYLKPQAILSGQDLIDLNFSVDVSMQEGDTAYQWIQAVSGTKVVYVVGFDLTYFSGHLVRRT